MQYVLIAKRCANCNKINIILKRKWQAEPDDFMEPLKETINHIVMASCRLIMLFLLTKAAYSDYIQMVDTNTCSYYV